MTLTEFNPYVRFMDRRNYVSTYPEFIMAYDHRLFYIDSGEIEADINGQNYTICQNQILLILQKHSNAVESAENTLYPSHQKPMPHLRSNQTDLHLGNMAFLNQNV